MNAGGGMAGAAVRVDPIRVIDLVREIVPYLHCAGRVAGMRVLVLPCRGGHGARHLALSARQVDAWGKPAEVRWARSHNPAPNLSYRVEGIDSLPGAAEYDAAFCFRGLLRGRTARPLLEQLRLSLRPGGTLYLVVPNRAHSSADDRQGSFDADELQRLLISLYSQVEILGISGNARYRELESARRTAVERLRRRDPLGIHRLAPRTWQERWRATIYRRAREQVLGVPHGSPYSIGPDDFQVGWDVATSDDLLAVGRLDPP